MVDHNGQAIGNETVRNGIQNYSPKDGLLYVWTEGMVSGSTETQYYEYMAKWWGEAADKLQDAFETEKKTITKSGNLYQGDDHRPADAPQQGQRSGRQLLRLDGCARSD